MIMKPTARSQFIHSLEHNFALSHAAISLATKHDEGDFRLLPIVLWKYGLVTLDEVEDMFDWLEINEVQSLRKS